MWTISLPLRVAIGKTKYFVLNLNQYRNEQFFNLNKSKIEFKRLITPLLKDIPVLKGCTLEYVLFPGSARSCDVANICSIQDKYFSDALVEAGLMEDDNYDFVPEVRYRFGEIDRLNPRVEVTITPMQTEIQGKEMRISINEVEIKQAIRLFIEDQITINEGQDIEIDINATRGPEGFTANIDIISPVAEEAPAATDTPVVRRRGRPPGSVNKPKEDTPIAIEAAPEASEAVQTQEEEVEVQPAEPAPVVDTSIPEQVAGVTAAEAKQDEGVDDSKLATSQEEVTNFIKPEEPAPAAVSAPNAEPAGGSNEAVAPTPRQSLFSGLARPVNG